jgi:hypothetical protein
MPAATTTRVKPTTSAEKWEERPLSHANPVLFTPAGNCCSQANVVDVEHVHVHVHGLVFVTTGCSMWF